MDLKERSIFRERKKKERSIQCINGDITHNDIIMSSLDLIGIKAITMIPRISIVPNTNSEFNRKAIDITNWRALYPIQLVTQVH